MTLQPNYNELNIAVGERTPGNQLFPVFLKLNQLHTVLIGAGKVGLEKLNAIMANSPLARVTVIALKISEEVYVLAAKYPTVIIKEKKFSDGDLDPANLVVAATNDSALNAYVRGAAHSRNLLINVADKPELCDFYLGSIVQKGDLKVAISTNGKSPTVAKRLKEVLNEGFPEDINITLLQISLLRETLTGDFTAKVKALNDITAVLVKQRGAGQV